MQEIHNSKRLEIHIYQQEKPTGKISRNKSQLKSIERGYLSQIYLIILRKMQ